MRLHDLKPNAGAKHRRKRLGSGESSGHGKTSGKGHKGQKARSGGSIRPGFEGGQMPLHRRLPKRGFNNAAFKTVYGIVNLDDLEKRFDDGAAINEKLLRGAGLVRGSLSGARSSAAEKSASSTWRWMASARPPERRSSRPADPS